MSERLMRQWAVLVAVPAFFGVLLPSGPSDWMPVHGAALLGAAAFLALWPSRTSALALAAVAFGLQVGGAEAAFTVTVFWVSLALALFGRAELAVASRCIGATIYGFAAANKAVSEAFMSGDVFWREQMHIPHLQRLALIVVISEFALALMVGVGHRWAPPVIVAFHVPTAFVIGDDPGHVIVLLGFGAVMAWLAWNGSAVGGVGRAGGSDDGSVEEVEVGDVVLAVGDDSDLHVTCRRSGSQHMG